MTPDLYPHCRTARVWISADLDGEATQHEQVALRAHLEECPECRAFAALVGAVTLHVRTSEPATVSRAPMVLRLPRPRRRGARVGRVLAPLAAAAAAAAATVVIAFSGVFGSGEPTVDTPAPIATVARDDAPLLDAVPEDIVRQNDPLRTGDLTIDDLPRSLPGL